MDSTVSFYGDIGFDADHRNVRDFASEEARTAWFAGKTHTTLQCNYDKVNRSLKVEMQYGEALAFSYCIVSIDGQRDMYCFIDSCEVINDRTVSFQLTVDPWQTYLFSFTLGRSFVVRSHMDRWKASSAKPSMQIYPNESIDGYQVVGAQRPLCAESSDEEYAWFVMARTVTPSADISYVEYDCSPVIPSLPLTDIKWSDGKDAPNILEILDGTLFTKLALDPNTVLFIGIATALPIGLSWTVSGLTATIGAVSGSVGTVEVGSYKLLKLTGPTAQPISNPPSVTLTATFDYPVKPASQNNTESRTFEPMMFMSPVRSIVAYSGLGQPVWSAPDDLVLSNAAMTIKATAIPSAGGFTSRYFIGQGFEDADALNRAFEIPAMAVDAASNNWLTYVATERDTTRQMMNLNVQRNIVTSTTSALSNSQTILGAVTGLISAGVDAATSAYFANKENAINEQGIKNRSNGALSSGSGTGALHTYSVIPTLVEEKADEATAKAFFDKVRMNGYAVNRFMTPDIRSRYWFNYISTIGAVVRGNFPESVRRELKAIFDAGVTIWHDDAEMDTDKCNIERSLIA